MVNLQTYACQTITVSADKRPWIRSFQVTRFHYLPKAMPKIVLDRSIEDAITRQFEELFWMR